MLKNHIRYYAIVRSGLHATYTWVSSLFEPKTLVFEPVQLTFKRVPDMSYSLVKGYAEAINSDYNLLITAYENVAFTAIPNHDSIQAENNYTIVLLRDFYNHFSSYSRMTTVDPLLFKKLWLEYAEAFLANDSSYLFLSYNHWFVSEEYRRDFCSKLNGNYTDKLLNYIPDEGSSFTKHKYQNRAQEMPVLSRYKLYPKEHLDLIDARILELNRLIFNSVLDLPTIEKELLG